MNCIFCYFSLFIFSFYFFCDFFKFSFTICLEIYFLFSLSSSVVNRTFTSSVNFPKIIRKCIKTIICSYQT